MGLRVTPRYFLTVDTRQNAGGAAGSASSYTLSLAAERLMARVGGRVRTTYYKNQRDPFAAPATQTALWIGSDLDVNIARAWYLMLSASAEHGGLAPTTQVYAGFSVRF